MKDSNYLQKVADFMTLFNQTIPQHPTIPSKEICDLRIKLIQEELNELQEAFNNNDKVEILDAFMDLQYVLTGAILACGMQEIVNEAFTNVHKSNMSKACKTMEEVENTIANYAKQGISTYYKKIDELGLYIVYRTSDNKVLKSINYSPANLKQFLK